MSHFSQVVDAADDLSIDEQETLLEILQRRIAMHNRAGLIADTADARDEFHSGGRRTASVGEIMDEVRGAP